MKRRLKYDPPESMVIWPRKNPVVIACGLRSSKSRESSRNLEAEIAAFGL